MVISMKKTINNGYIDIHTHILSEVDDGSKSMMVSMEMLDIAYLEGIRGIVATPHYHPVKCMMDYEAIFEKFKEFQDSAKSRYPDMKIYLGREIYYTSDVLELIEQGARLTYEDTEYILVEYSPRADYNYIRTSINSILQAGLIPVIAHIERYECMVEDLENVEEVREMGAIIQVNASSILGGSGKTIKKFTKKLLKNQLVDIVATDAHSAGTRAPRINECATYLHKKYGQEYTEELLIYNPQRIIEGKYLEELN